MFRRMLNEQMDIVEDGGTPMNVYDQDPGTIVLPCESYMYPGYDEIGGPFKGNVPRKPDVEQILSGSGARLKEWDGIEKKQVISGVSEATGGALRDGAWFSDGRKH